MRETRNTVQRQGPPNTVPGAPSVPDNDAEGLFGEAVPKDLGRVDHLAGNPLACTRLPMNSKEPTMTGDLT
jgi:hypothetical protein